MAIEISGLPSTAVSNSGETTQTNTPTGTTNGQTQSTSGANPAVADAVTITKNAQNLHLIETDINASSEIDGERVESLKTAIDTGAYSIDPSRVAEKFLQFEAELMV
jgi:negative regulator of flagellin synthesis FlgM